MHNANNPEDENGWGENPPSRPVLKLGWMFSFSDLMTLMLAFFVMMFAMSAIQTQAWKSIVTGLSDELSPGREQALLHRKEAARPLRVLEPKGIDLGYLEAVMREKFRNHPVLANANMRRREGGIVIALPVEMLFQPENAQAAQTASVTLDAIGRSLSSVKNRMEVHVYAASGARPALSSEGGFASAWELALSRAITIKKLLAENGGAMSIVPVGHELAAKGDAQPSDLVELIIRELDAG